MNFSLEKIVKYCDNFTTSQPKHLYELERETNLKTLAPQMLSGHYQGQILKMFSTMMRPKSVLEIGTFTGYATQCLSNGLIPGGIVHTIEANEELRYIIENGFEKSGISNKIQLYIGDAKKIIPTLDEVFDIVFIDAGKTDYATYFDLVIDKVRSGGLIMADNVLWSGKVVMENHDNDTRALHEFNQKIHNDNRVENSILPIRDGIMMIVKK